MMDFGAVSTALGALISSIIASLVTWKAMTKDVKKSDAEIHLDMNTAHNTEERQWRAELNQENDELRTRAAAKAARIEVLLDQLEALKIELTEKKIEIKNMEHLIKNLRHIIEQYKALVKHDTTGSSEQSPTEITPGPSDFDPS